MAEKTSYGRRATAYRHTLQATGSESLARQARRQQIRATIGAGISTMARIGAKTLTAGALATMGPVGLAGSAALAYSEVQRFKEHLNENVMRRRDLLYSDYMNRLAREDAVQSVAATREGDKMGVGNTGDGQSSSHGTGTATASGEKQSVDTPQYRSDGTPPNEDLASHSVLSSCRR